MVIYVAIELVLLQKVYVFFRKIFHETYLSTTRLSTIQSLMSLANSGDYQLKQMDRKTAYPNAPIEKDVAITQPKGFEL